MISRAFSSPVIMLEPETLHSHTHALLLLGLRDPPAVEQGVGFAFATVFGTD